MPVLAERTKIRTETGNISSTTGLNFYSGYSAPYRFPVDLNIDANAYMIASGSIQIQILSYIPELSMKAKEVLHKLYSFHKLKPDWDGNGSLVPTEDIIRITSNFLSDMDEYDLPVYFTAPGPNGEIVLEYKNNENTAEIFFENDHSTEMLLYKDKNQIYAGEVDKKVLIDHLTPGLAAHGR